MGKKLGVLGQGNDDGGAEKWLGIKYFWPLYASPGQTVQLAPFLVSGSSACIAVSRLPVGCCRGALKP